MGPAIGPKGPRHQAVYRAAPLRSVGFETRRYGAEQRGYHPWSLRRPGTVLQATPCATDLG